MRIILTTILLVAFFVNPLAAQELTGTLQQIKKSGKIRIGYREAEPPMSFKGKDGEPTGYTIDICKYVVTGVKDKIGTDIRVEYVPVTAKERFDALVNNEIDILCGSTTKTLSRSELVDFTQLTFVTGASLMTLKGKQINDTAALNGKKVGVVKGTTTAVVLRELLQKTLTLAVTASYDTAGEGMEALRKGHIDAFSADQIVLIGLASNAEDPNTFAIASVVFSYEPFALAVRRNDADFRLVADRALSRLYRSGEILQIYERWVGRFVPRRPPVYDAMFQLNATPE
ncbi:MAG: amino acid ABC transporter substrate-binding protein [Proteobacteria bacterium]|nr:amino acid ABC transporter substrate-binding protein [Pseudomonadota bacterium]